MKQLIIVGAGGLGREVYAWAKQSLGYGTEFTIKGFIDDNLNALASYRYEHQVLGTISGFQPQSDDEVYALAIGSPVVKRQIFSRLSIPAERYPTLVHRSVIMAEGVQLGSGVILCPNIVVGADARLANLVCVDNSTVIGHDAQIGAFSHISSLCSITGFTTIGEECFVGTGSRVLPSVILEDKVTVGAGSVVTKNVASGATVKGVPAK